MKLNSKVKLLLSKLAWRKRTTKEPRTGAFERDFELNFGVADFVRKGGVLGLFQGVLGGKRAGLTTFLLQIWLLSWCENGDGFLADMEQLFDVVFAEFLEFRELFLGDFSCCVFGMILEVYLADV